MSLAEAQVLEALRTVQYPGFTRDVVSFGIVRDLQIAGDTVRFRLEVGPGNPAVAQRLEQNARIAVERLPDVAHVEIRVGGPAPGQPLPKSGRAPSVAEAGALDGKLLPNVRHVVAVASGKGGVGKSTVAVNLAVALAKQGATVGLLDADVYGPSIPLMMGVDNRPSLDAEGTRLLPFRRHGVSFMSLGFMVERDTAVIWRGPMVMKAVEQLLRDVAWGELDVLVVDMPPGTGDAQLTLSQKVHLSGAVIVTTPQEVALVDAVKGVNMFQKVNVPILGIIENMSYFECPHCHQRSDIFGHGGGGREAKSLDVPFLGEIPLDPAIPVSGDSGSPLVAAEPNSPRSRAFLNVAAVLLKRLHGEEH